MFGPVDGRVCDSELGESKDYVLTSTAHDIEEVFWGDPFNVHVEGASITDCTSLVCSLVYVANGNGGGKFFCRETVLPDKLSVDAGGVGTEVY